MGKNTSATLGSHFDQFIAQAIANGRFGSASEIVRAGLRVLEENENKLVALRQAIKFGEEGGFSKDYSFKYHEKVRQGLMLRIRNISFLNTCIIFNNQLRTKVVFYNELEMRFLSVD